MLKMLLAVVATAAAIPAFAEEIRVSAPIEAGSLSVDGVAVVAYYRPLADDAFELTVTWLGEDDAEASRLAMRLEEGDAVAFSLPGHMDTLFTFSRDFDAVTIGAEPATSGAIRNASL